MARDLGELRTIVLDRTVKSRPLARPRAYRQIDPVIPPVSVGYLGGSGELRRGPGCALDVEPWVLEHGYPLFVPPSYL